MSLIKREVKTETEKIWLRLPVELVEKLKAYSLFLASSRDHVVAQAVQYVIDKDAEFAKDPASKTRGNSGDAVGGTSGDRKGVRAVGDSP